MKYVRLKKQTDFDKLFQKGKRAFSPSLTMLYTKSKQTTMGISVGKRHGKSVVRNRIKRLLREAFRAELPKMKHAYAIVLIPKVAEKYDYHLFRQHIAKMIEKDAL